MTALLPYILFEVTVPL